MTYRIDADVLSYNGCEITVQSQKVKLFYFQSGSTQALLNCFKTKIAQNASEFRLLPNMDSVLRHRNYSEIFDLRNEEGINKFRGITGIELDKFALSKFLGKYRKVSGMIQSKEENEFEKDLMLILDERTLISNYGTWERLFEILILNNRYDLYKQLAIRIVDAIERYSVPENMCNASVKTHDSLLRVFLSAMQRTTAIVWNADIDRVLDAVCEKVGKLRGNPKYTQALITMFDKETIYTTRTAYCETRMVNKYLLPLPIDCVINNLGKEEANQITYTDYIGLMMSSVSTIINAISYVLIGFVSISLVVSSIMIGIITYISVLERTKEIGVLRAIGASKKDISRVFNAEAFLVGLVSGILGIVITLGIDVIINIILYALVGLQIAKLPVLGAFILIGISVALSLIAGLIPSGFAAKRDPVIALRSE